MSTTYTSTPPTVTIGSTSQVKWAGGVPYISANEVLQYMKIANPQPSDYMLLNNIIIPIVCQYIDELTGTTWGVKTTTEYYSIGRPSYLGWYLIGSPVYLQHYPIYAVSSTHTAISLGIWNGTQYQQWVNYMVEARWGSYWFDKAAGILWIIGWYWYMGYEVAITYKYGYNTAGTLNLDGRIRLLSLYKATKLFLDNERYTAQVSEGIGGISMQDLWKYLVQDIAEIEHWIQSFRVMTGSWMP
jgi:hypothetical protein